MIKKVSLVALIVTIAMLILLVTVAIINAKIPKMWNYYNSKTLLIDSVPYELWIADNPVKQYQGLSDILDKSDLNGKSGMVFEYAESSTQSFVNRRTYLNLKVIWMKGNTVVGESFLPSLKENGDREVIVTSPEPVNRVVELVVN
jgi:uncharacterized membrane protein (UPF0127 family)